MAIPDEALHDAREASRLFASTPRGSEAEREAAAALAAAFDALDDHLSAGGGLPGDWERLTARLPSREDILADLTAVRAGEEN